MANPWAGVVAGAGQGIMALNDYLTSQDVDKAMGRSIADRGRFQDKIDERLMGEIGSLRALSPEEERASAMNDFVMRLRSARASQPTSYGARGTVSDREAAGLKELSSDLGVFGNREADITARIDSQRRMREKEGLGLSRAGSDVRLLGNQMSSMDFLNQLRLARKSRKNPWLDMLGEGLKGAGQAMGGGMGGGGGSSAPLGQSAGANFDPSIYD